jgi:nucleoid-associated protein YgaU
MNNREVKLGLMFILVLLIVLGAVVARRLNRAADSAIASASKLRKPGDEPVAPSNVPKNGKSTLLAQPTPTLLSAANPAATRIKRAPDELGQWEDRTDQQRSAAYSPSVLPAAATAAADDRYAAAGDGRQAPAVSPPAAPTRIMAPRSNPVERRSAVTAIPKSSATAERQVRPVQGDCPDFRAATGHRREATIGVSPKMGLSPLLDQAGQPPAARAARLANSSRKPSDPNAPRVAAASTTAAGLSSGGRTYAVRQGDTLFSIARDELGKSSRWGEIYELNHDALGADFKALSPGTMLILPGKEASEPAERITQRPPIRYDR